MQRSTHQQHNVCSAFSLVHSTSTRLQLGVAALQFGGRVPAAVSTQPNKIDKVNIGWLFNNVHAAVTEAAIGMRVHTRSVCQQIPSTGGRHAAVF